MPWEEKSKVMTREEFVKRALSHETSKSMLCKEYGISRPTGDLWIKRYLAGEDLSDRSKAPFKTANKTPQAIENTVVEYRKKYPAIGATKIHKMLENEEYSNIPSISTINEIFKRNGLITPKASRDATPIKRFNKNNPNEMWQGDFKGHFAMKNNMRCHPLNIIDDCSRFCLCSEPLEHESFEDVQPVMIRLFEEYGLPFSFLCDNGNPWGTSQTTGFTKFEVWLMDLGILTLHGRALHPQTQGKTESFNRSLTKELLNHTEFDDFYDAKVKLDNYRDFYNNKRPHHALNLETPSDVYTKSNKQYTEKISNWDYPSDCILHKVKSKGYISYKGQGYFLSEAFGERTIAIRESHTLGQVDILYRQFILGRIDIEKRVFTFKRAYLINGDPRFESVQK